MWLQQEGDLLACYGRALVPLGCHRHGLDLGMSFGDLGHEGGSHVACQLGLVRPAPTRLQKHTAAPQVPVDYGDRLYAVEIAEGVGHICRYSQDMVVGEGRSLQQRLEAQRNQLT